MKSIQILDNILILITTYIHSCIRGKAKKTPKELRTVLVVQPAKLGDMVCATPIFHALRTHNPNIRIVVMGSALNRELLADNTDVDDYIVNNQSPYKLARCIRTLHVDTGLVLVPDSSAIAALFLGDVPLIVAPEVVNGYCPWQTKTYRLLRRLVRTMQHRMEHYAPGEYLRLLEPLGIYTNDTKKHLSYSDKACKNVDAFLHAHSLKEKKFAIISPSSGNKIKNWKSKRFARVAEYVVSKGFPVVIIGGSRDKEEVTAMMQAIGKQKGITNASEKFSIDELKAFIAKAGLFISVDTGTLYIAEAFGVPTVDIVGPMSEQEQPPMSTVHLVVVPERDAPQLHVMNARMYDKKEAQRQVDSISVEKVYITVDSILL